MTPKLTFDPYELMPFTGYLDPETGRQVKYLSLAHFIHSERVAGIDEQYRKYLLKLEDPELFRLEVDGVAITCGERPNWSDTKGSLLYAGIFMQALSNRDRYSQYVERVEQLSVASCSFSDDAAAALGHFIGDINAPQDALKVVFLGDNRNSDYIQSCLSTVFAKRGPLCLLALEDDGCSAGVSTFARAGAVAYSLIDAALSDDSIVDNIKRRCTHVFHFQGGNDSPLTASVLRQLGESSINVLPIPPKS